MEITFVRGSSTLSSAERRFRGRGALDRRGHGERRGLREGERAIVEKSTRTTSGKANPMHGPSKATKSVAAPAAAMRVVAVPRLPGRQRRRKSPQGRPRPRCLRHIASHTVGANPAAACDHNLASPRGQRGCVRSRVLSLACCTYLLRLFLSGRDRDRASELLAIRSAAELLWPQ